MTSLLITISLELKDILGKYFSSVCSDYGRSGCGLPQADASSSNFQNILQIAFAVLAALAVLFIVIGGLRMITAQGNPQEVGKAKGTIVYALVGLLVALIAEALVAFVLGNPNL